MTPTQQAYVGSVVRAILMLLPFVAKSLDADQQTTLAGIVAAALAFGWSLWQKKSTADAKHTAVAIAVSKAVAAPESAEQIIADAKAGKF